MNVQDTEQFWTEREPRYPHELAGALRDFSREAHTRGELVLCGTLRVAADRLERQTPPALPDRAELERRGERGLTTEQGLELERTAVRARELEAAGYAILEHEDRRRAELDRRATERGRERRQTPAAVSTDSRLPHVLRLVARSSSS